MKELKGTKTEKNLMEAFAGESPGVGIIFTSNGPILKFCAPRYICKNCVSMPDKATSFSSKYPFSPVFCNKSWANFTWSK